VNRCACHARPTEWCPERDLPTTITGWHGTRSAGVITHAPHTGECGICGHQYRTGEPVVALPAPSWAHPYAHEACPSR
jgi:hypothetical protein